MMLIYRPASEDPDSMKTFAMITIAALVGVLAMLYLFRDDVTQLVMAQLSSEMFVQADRDNFDPGPAVGSHFPGLRASYQGGSVSLLREFAGANGTMFIASRSLQWCPYCMRQMIQLQEHKNDFDEAGIGMVAITYDQPDQQQQFIDKFAITIPVLADIDALSFSTLGILNEAYQPGDSRYGIPHPGMIIVDPDGKVVGKLFLEAYSSRVDSSAALTFAKEALGLRDSGAAQQ